METPIQSEGEALPNAIDITNVCKRNFRAVCDMETPIVIIGDLLQMLNIVCSTPGDVFTSENDACALQRTVWLASEQLKAVERIRGDLFDWNHANPEMIAKGGRHDEQDR